MASLCRNISQSFLLIWVTGGLLGGCSHTTHVAPSADGKSAWIAHDSLVLFIFNSNKFYCMADEGKPKCIRVEEKSDSSSMKGI
jgi:hypothetical protein